MSDDTSAFKNFHRVLCERFGYSHDEKDWRRDQVSLIEHIAKSSTERVPGSYTGIEPFDLARIRELEDGLRKVLDQTGRGSVTHQTAAQALAGSKALPDGYSTDRLGVIEETLAGLRKHGFACDWGKEADLMWCVAEITRLRTKLRWAEAHIERSMTATS